MFCLGFKLFYFYFFFLGGLKWELLFANRQTLRMLYWEAGYRQRFSALRGIFSAFECCILVIVQARFNRGDRRVEYFQFAQALSIWV